MNLGARKTWIFSHICVGLASEMLPTPLVPNLQDDKVYEPSEDSYLLIDCFEAECGFLRCRFHLRVPVVCEIGSGSGIVITFIQQHILPKSHCIATDINPHACDAVLETAGANKQIHSRGVSPRTAIDACNMSLTGGIRRRQVDVLVFNPPYVPAEDVPIVPSTLEDSTWLDLALLGGADGMEITQKVLDNLGETLDPERGVAYILFCARNKPEEVALRMRRDGWAVETVIRRKAGWEVLSVLRFTRR